MSKHIERTRQIVGFIFYGLIAAPLIALIPLTMWARVKAKGHTLSQTVVGALLSAGMTSLALLLYGFRPGAF